MARKIVEARVVAWEPSHPKWKWGVAVRYDDGKKAMWPVGDREAAEAQVARLMRGGVKLRVV